MNLSEIFPTDPEKIEKGVPVKIDGATFQMSYFNSSKAQLIFTTQTRNFAAKMTPEDAVVAAMNYVLVHVVILGWTNLKETSDEDENGEKAVTEVPYSKEALEDLLIRFDGFGPLLMGHAMEIANFKEEEKIKTLGK